MQMSINSFKKFAALVVASSIVMYLITTYVFHSDKAISAVKKFVASNKEVVAQAGEVKKVELIKRVSVSATETSSPYRLYTFLIDGNKSKATVVVQVEQAGIKEQYQIKVIQGRD